ncbi:MAG: hypothetical protein GC191_05715 [Azospirillum sp.]|nr:hypothetical protein [Azospirillum sp.]
MVAFPLEDSGTMTLRQFSFDVWQWLAADAGLLFGVCLAVPMVGSAMVWLLWRGRAYGIAHAVAGTVVGGALALAILYGLVLAVAVAGFRADLLAVDLRLLAGPPLLLVGSLVGIGRIYPLGRLEAIRVAREVMLLLLGCATVLWLFGKFHGWGIFFVGSLGQAVVIGAVALLWLRRQWRRASGLDFERPAP